MKTIMNMALICIAIVAQLGFACEGAGKKGLFSMCVSELTSRNMRGDIDQPGSDYIRACRRLSDISQLECIKELTSKNMRGEIERLSIEQMNDCIGDSSEE